MIWLFAITATSAFIASLLTFFSGFGLGTLLLPVLALFVPITSAVGIVAIVHLLSSLFKLAIMWSQTDWFIVKKFGLPALFSAIIGAWMLARLGNLPEVGSYEIFTISATITPIKLVVGFLMICFAIAEYLNLAKHFAIPPNYLPIGGLLSGFFGGLSGHQGAFRSAFLLRSGLDKEKFVATSAAIASIVDISRLVVYGINLKIITSQANISLIFVITISALAGVLVGKFCLAKITISFIQKLVAVLLLVLGLLIILGIV